MTNSYLVDSAPRFFGPMGMDVYNRVLVPNRSKTYRRPDKTRPDKTLRANT